MVLSTKSAERVDHSKLPQIGVRRLRDVKPVEAARARPAGLKSIFFKGHSPIVPPMLIRARHIATIAAFALAGAILGGCSSINERIGPTIGDTLPAWAGGLPKDAPPRKGTPEYDAYMKEQERKRLEPAPANANASAPTTSSGSALAPVH